MAKTKTTSTKTIKEEKKVIAPEDKITATVTIPPENAALNIRAEPNGKIVGELKNGCTVNVLNTFTVNDEEWAQIGENKFVKRFYLKI